MLWNRVRKLQCKIKIGTINVNYRLESVCNTGVCDVFYSSYIKKI